MVQNYRYVIFMPFKDLIIIQKMEFLLLQKKYTAYWTGSLFCQLEAAVKAQELCSPTASFYRTFPISWEKQHFRQLWFPLYRKCLRYWPWNSETGYFWLEAYNYTTFFTWRKGALMDSGPNSGSLWSGNEAACKKVDCAWYFSITEFWQYWFFWNNHRQYF